MRFLGGALEKPDTSGYQKRIMFYNTIVIDMTDLLDLSFKNSLFVGLTVPKSFMLKGIDVVQVICEPSTLCQQ